MKNIIFRCILCLMFLSSCSQQRSLIYHRVLPQSIKRIAVLPPDKQMITNEFSAEFLQKMLAYMVFQETAYFIQPLDSTNALIERINFAENSLSDIGMQLKVDGLLRYDFVDLLENEGKREGFILSVSLVDCEQGKGVWQSIRKYKGKENLKQYQALKQYFSSKMKGSIGAYFAELYSVLREAFKNLPEPKYSQAERTKRLLDTTEPF